jgi:predicted HicB family RNase H-like nuclease
MTKDYFEYKGFRGSILASIEDRCLHGRIKHIDSVVTFEANTVEELESAFKDAVDDYLETCEEMGICPEKPYKGSFNIRIDPELHRQAAHSASTQGISLNSWVEKAIADKLQTVTMSIVGSPSSQDGAVFISATNHQTGEKVSATLNMQDISPVEIVSASATKHNFPVARPTLRVVK